MTKAAIKAAQKRYDNDPEFAYLVDMLGKHLTRQVYTEKTRRQAFELANSSIVTVRLQVKTA